MTGTLNRYQANYIAAKAAVEAHKEAVEEVFMNYVRKHKLKDDTGKIATVSYAVADNAEFEKMLSDLEGQFGEDDENLSRELGENLDKAEDDLIMWGLSLIPKTHKREMEVLKRNTIGENKNYAIRQEMIEITMKYTGKGI